MMPASALVPGTVVVEHGQAKIDAGAAHQPGADVGEGVAVTTLPEAASVDSGADDRQAGRGEEATPAAIVQFPDRGLQRRRLRGGTGWRILTDVELEAMPSPNWLVENLLPEKGRAALYGPSGLGKSFVALDIAGCIAAGLPWHGRPVRQGTVVYVTGEGRGGLGSRLHVWKHHYGQGQIPLGFVTETFSLQFDPERAAPDAFDPVQEAIDKLRRLQPRLIVFDPFARFIVGGDENSSRDVGLALANIDAICEELGCTALVIHHTGKDGNDERGSSAFRAGMDTMIQLHKVGYGMELAVSKQKDGEPAGPLSLRLETVTTPSGITSCVVMLGGARKGSDGKPVLDDSLLRMLVALDQSFDQDGAATTPWRKVVEISMSDATFYRKVKALLDDQYIDKVGQGRGTRYILTDKGRDALTLTLNSLS